MFRKDYNTAPRQPAFLRKPLMGAVALASVCTGMTLPQAVAQDEGFVIEEVTVTARRREESLQEVPVSVAVVDAAAIENRGLQSIDDIARFTPGLSFSKAFGRATERPVIRGLGNVLAGVQFGVESGAAYFVDGVYYPGDLQGLNLNDLERVEVIKGPQSALYGRNSYSGAINFVTKSPTQEMTGDVRLLFAEDGEQDLRASISGPLIPGVLSACVAMSSTDSGPTRSPRTPSAMSLRILSRVSSNGRPRIECESVFEASIRKMMTERVRYSCKTQPRTIAFQVFDRLAHGLPAAAPTITSISAATSNLGQSHSTTRML